MLGAVATSARRRPRCHRLVAVVPLMAVAALTAAPGSAPGDPIAPWATDALVRQALPGRADVRLLRAADADDRLRQVLLGDTGSSFVHCGDFRRIGAADCAVVGRARRDDGEPVAFVAILSRAESGARVEFLRELETDFAVLAILPGYRHGRDVILVRFVFGSDLDRGIAWNGRRYESLPE